MSIPGSYTREPALLNYEATATQGTACTYYICKYMRWFMYRESVCYKLDPDQSLAQVFTAIQLGNGTGRREQAIGDVLTVS